MEWYGKKQTKNTFNTLKNDVHRIIIGKNVLIRTSVTVYMDVNIGNNCWINHNAIIREKVSILEDTTIGSNTIIENNVSIGKRCVIHNNTMIQPLQQLFEPLPPYGKVLHFLH